MKKAKVNVVNTTDTVVTDTQTAAEPPTSGGAAGPVAALNSVQQVQRDYSFSPDSCDFWSVTSSAPIKIQRLWGKMEAATATQPLGHYIFDNVRGVWKRSAPPNHAAKKVRIELDRASYAGQVRTKERRTPIYGPAFPDTGAQVTLINPALVKTMGGANLVRSASLLIKDAGGHLMKTEGAIFVVISHREKVTGLIRQTRQMAYLSPQTEDVVLSREAMETLKLVADLDDSGKASVNLVSKSTGHFDKR